MGSKVFINDDIFDLLSLDAQPNGSMMNPCDDLFIIKIVFYWDSGILLLRDQEKNLLSVVTWAVEIQTYVTFLETMMAKSSAEDIREDIPSCKTVRSVR